LNKVNNQLPFAHKSKQTAAFMQTADFSQNEKQKMNYWTENGVLPQCDI